jgi:predicted ATPase/DNA-binding SARP family transcriptional activator
MAPPGAVRLHLFGLPALLGVAPPLPFGPERRFQLLVVLALAGQRGVPRERLGALLWPGSPAAQARSNLRTALHRVRQLPGLHPGDAAVRWVVDTDLQAFDAALLAGDTAGALALARGALLEGMDDPANPAWTDWLTTLRGRVGVAWQAAAAAQLARLEDPSAVIDLAERMLAVDPLDEAAMAARLRVERAQGRAAQAQRLYARFAQRLSDELDVEPSQALRALGAPGSALAGAPAAPAVQVPGPAPVPVPVPVPVPSAQAGFIGRRLECAEARALLQRPDCRLLTLLGPGGIGKSRLARAVAGLHDADRAGPSPDFPGGRLWLDLQDLPRAPALLPRLGALLALQSLDESAAVAQIAAALPGVRTLLVLDNAEHLLALPQDDALPPLLGALLSARPALCVLVTSRERLAGAGTTGVAALPEWLMPVPGLAVPEDESRDLEAAGSFDAVRLFAERAHAADPRFELRRQLQPVIDITRAVGGMPLALELAAHWLRLMPPAEVAAALREPLELLERHPAAAGAPARPEHASMRQVLDRSVALLSEPERQALAAVSVFQDGFTREAARALGRVAALPLLSSLVDRSLLASDADRRFRLHPLVQARAVELLRAEPALAQAVRRAHVAHHAAWLAALVPLTRGDMHRLVQAIDGEFANLCVAWELAASPAAPQPRALGEMVRAWWVYFEVGGRPQEGIRRLRPALPVLESCARHDPVAAWALSRLRHGLSMLMHRGGHQAEGLAVAEAGMAAGMLDGDLEAHVGCVLNSGSCLLAQGRPARAQARFQRALALAEAQGDAHCTAWALGNVAVGHTALGEPGLSIAAGRRALAIDRALGNQYQVAVYLINLGAALHGVQDWPAAIEVQRDALQHAQAHGLRNFVDFARSNLAVTLVRVGQLDEARSLLGQTLQSARAQGLRTVQVRMQSLLARLEARAGHPATALQALREAVRLAREHQLLADLLGTLRAWAELLHARGEVAQALRVLRVALDHPATSPGDRPAIEAVVGTWAAAQAHGPSGWQAAGAEGLTLDAVLAAIEADSAP